MAVLTLALAVIVPSTAQAELTVEKLVSNAVPGVGPYFQDVADAIRKFGSRDYDGAFKNLENARKLAPRLAPPQIMMAQLYLDAGMSTPAYSMLEQAMKSVPQDPEASVLLAERALLEGRLTESAVMFQRAYKLADPFTDNPRRRQDLLQRILLGSATVDDARGDFNEAKAKLEALIKLDQRNAAAHEKMGKVLLALKDPRKALDEFQLAADTDPKMLPAGIAMAYLATEPGQAEKWVNYAIGKSPNDVRTQVAAASFLLRNNQADAALEHAQKALALEPANLEALIVAGLISRLRGDYAAAAKHLSQAHLLNPLNPVILNNLPLVLVELPDPESKQRALLFAELGTRYNPNQGEALITLGWINYRLKNRREAHRVFNAAMNSPQMTSGGVITSEMAYYMANFARDQGDTKQAVSLLTEALNTALPFGYRKAAEDMLAELNKLEKSPAGGKGEKSATPNKAAQPPVAEAAAKPAASDAAKE